MPPIAVADPRIIRARLAVLVHAALVAILRDEIEKRKSRVRRALRRRERQRQVYHGFCHLQASGFARHVRPATFAARFLKLRLSRVPKLLLR